MISAATRLHIYWSEDVFEEWLRDASENSIARGEGPLSPRDIAEFLRDGPSNMPETGQYIIDLLE